MRFIGGRNIKQLLRTAGNLQFNVIADYVGEGGNKFQQVHNSIPFLGNRHLAVKLSGIGMSSDNLNRVLHQAEKHNCTVLIDAESVAQTPVIQRCTENSLLRKQHTGPVYTTIQCYRKDALRLLERDLMLYGFDHGIKLVRGAYWKQDQCTGQLWANKDETDKCYHDALKLLSGEPNPVIVASHNEDSCRYAESLSDKFEYAQLLGMADNLSSRLHEKGHKVYKYVPWGPWHESIPYLLRRLQENKDMIRFLGN